MDYITVYGLRHKYLIPLTQVNIFNIHQKYGNKYVFALEYYMTMNAHFKEKL